MSTATKVSNHEIIDAMSHYGGSFAKALANAFRRADSNNFERLKAAFPEIWNEYIVLKNLNIKTEQQPNDPMKKLTQKEISFCGACGRKQEYGIESCIGCGVEHCGACAANLGYEYRHGVYVSVSGDGYYCDKCDLKLTARGDKCLAAYKKIAALRSEITTISADFELRRQEAEEELKLLRCFSISKPNYNK